MRITKGSDHSVVPNSINTTIEDTGMRNSSVIYVKDLGACLYPTHIMDNANPTPRISTLFQTNKN